MNGNERQGRPDGVVESVQPLGEDLMSNGREYSDETARMLDEEIL